MIKFINKLTGGAMWVADERADEYKAAGHKLAADNHTEAPAEKPKGTAKKRRK